MNQLATSLIEPLNTQSAHIAEWIERFDVTVSLQPAVLACTEEEAKQKLKATFLLSCLGEDGYCLIKASLAPDNLMDKSFEELKHAILELAPKHSVISQSYKLSSVKQEANETLNVFMSRVKEIAVKCDYGNSFDRIVRDKFICGLKSEKLRAHLISDDSVKSSSDALSKAIAKENSNLAAHDMSTNFVSKSQKNQKDNYQKTFIRLRQLRTHQVHQLVVTGSLRSAQSVQCSVILQQTAEHVVGIVRKLQGTLLRIAQRRS